MLWVWEEVGHIGKTFMADWLQVWRGACVITGGKHADIGEMFDCEDYVVFDYSRAQEDAFPYKLLEEFKNLRVMSPKWGSYQKQATVCKLVVFTNFAPNRVMLSADRWDVLHVNLNPVPVQLIV